MEQTDNMNGNGLVGILRSWELTPDMITDVLSDKYPEFRFEDLMVCYLRKQVPDGYIVRRSQKSRDPTSSTTPPTVLFQGTGKWPDVSVHSDKSERPLLVMEAKVVKTGKRASAWADAIGQAWLYTQAFTHVAIVILDAARDTSQGNQADSISIDMAFRSDVLDLGRPVPLIVKRAPPVDRTT